MQLDMHYYATYTMARASGFSVEASKAISTSSQFVDDNIYTAKVKFNNGISIKFKPTAHNFLNYKNVLKQNQYKIWVPFHFIPGNNGSRFLNRLICEKNSKLVKEMVKHNLSFYNKDYYLEILGITAHAYADSFSHYGFSGISSKKNKVMNDSFKFYDLDPLIEKYIKSKFKNYKRNNFKENGLLEVLKGWLAEKITGSLGHGAVANYPDRPYLVWSFKYEIGNKKKQNRDNIKNYIECCIGLYNFFIKAGDKLNNHCSVKDRIDFEDIKPILVKLISFQGKLNDRNEKWKKAALEGKLFKGSEAIPDYEDFKDKIKEIIDKKRIYYKKHDNVYKFYQAASFHRNYILKELFPKYKIFPPKF